MFQGQRYDINHLLKIIGLKVRQKGATSGFILGT